MGKFHRPALTTLHLRFVAPFEIVYVDIWRPYPVINSSEMHYFLLFVDDYTRYKWLFVMNNKGQVSQLFYRFHALVERQFNYKIKHLHSDGGAQFKSLEPFLFQGGYLTRISCSYTPSQNKVVEKQNKLVVEIRLCMTAKGSNPLKFWEYAFQTATFLTNRLPSHTLTTKVLFNFCFILFLITLY